MGRGRSGAALLLAMVMVVLGWTGAAGAQAPGAGAQHSLRSP
jgi:hypothetical protein